MPRKKKEEKTNEIEDTKTGQSRVLKEELAPVMGSRFGRYSKYIIQDRALPDVRDGLKPVQRRVLYSMFHEGNRSEKAYRKSAKTVGNVIGNYHPHGDSSVYEAMSRLAQDWKMRHCLVDMHGNKGSIDGDSPAAMRYTEARLAKIAEELLFDIDKETVDMVWNFDDTEKEPTVLPSSYPNILVNGATGISAGYATDIPPHNLREVIEGTIKLIDNPDMTIDEMLEIIKGPDFPGGAIVEGWENIKKASETGKGAVTVRSRVDVEELRGGKQQIVITEIPFEVNKKTLVTKIDEIRIDKKIDGIAEVRDETDKSGIRIAVELKKDAPADLIINYLYQNTDLCINYNYNMVVIDERTPQQYGIIDMLKAFIKHRKEVVTRRAKYEVTKAKKRLHIVEGLMKALSILDDVVKSIRNSKNKASAKENLVKSFDFSIEQAEAIVNLQLYRLSNTDIKELQKEERELTKEVKKLEGILGSNTKLKTLIKKELQEISDKYGLDRITEIRKESKAITVDAKQLIQEEDVYISVSRDGYIKRSSSRSFNSSGGFDAVGKKDDDELVLVSEGNTLQTLLAFTDTGEYAFIPVHSLQEEKWKDVGTHLNHIVTTTGFGHIVQAFLVDDFSKTKDFVTIIKNNGLIKRTPLSDYEVSRFSKLISAIKMKTGEIVTTVERTKGDSKVIIYTSKGLSLMFNEDEVAPKGLKTVGMKAIDLKEDDAVSYAYLSNSQSKIKEIAAKHGVAQNGSRGNKGAKPKLPKKKSK